MKLIITISFLSTFNYALSQQNNIDSLLEIVSYNRSDARTFYAVKKLGELFEKENPERSIAYYRHAMEFPFLSKYANEFVQVCNSLGELYHHRGMYDSSFLLHRQALSLTQKFNLEKESALAYQGIGLNFMRLSQHDSARYYFKQVLVMALQLKDLSLQAGGYNNLGNVSLEESNNQGALEKFIKAAELYERINNTDGLSKALSNIGNIENILGHYDKALDYTQRALAISEKNNSDFNVAYCHRLIGRIYRKQKNYDKALEEYELAAKIYSQLGDQRNEGETRQSIGNIYFDQGKYKEALVESGKSIRIARKISNSSLFAYTFSSIAFAWYELKQFDKAITYFDSSAIKARVIKNRYLVMDAYEAKSGIYAEQNQYKSALEFHQLYSALKDSLTSEENRQATEELEAKYQNTKKQAEIELLRKDQELKNISLKQSRTLQTAMATAFGLLIVIGLLVSNRNKVINQAKRQMEIEKVRNQIARDLHDDIGSTLSSINLISQVALQENPSRSILYFKKIGEQSAKTMESMSDMVWSINPDNDTLQKTVVKMKEFSAEILEPKNMGYQFQVDEKLNDVSLDVARRKNLFLVFKEAINNAAKYSDGTFVNVSIFRIHRMAMACEI
ncbi:MAG: tetratricopeptide repeat protein [Bacteroidetes bacterium]|nr:tetratricopeptide repeat protein [Bacteroidota bacterium]